MKESRLHREQSRREGKERPPSLSHRTHLGITQAPKHPVTTQHGVRCVLHSSAHTIHPGTPVSAWDFISERQPSASPEGKPERYALTQISQQPRSAPVPGRSTRCPSSPCPRERGPRRLPRKSSRLRPHRQPASIALGPQGAEEAAERETAAAGAAQRCAIPAGQPAALLCARGEAGPAR